MTRIIAIANQKGGVGKTTTAVNLAASLAVAGRSTLLVDCDPQGNATSGLGVILPKGGRTLYHLLIDQARPDEVLRATGLERLTVLGSDVDLFGAEMELAQMPGRQHLLADRLGPILDRYHYVFLDCPPSLGLLTLNALTACQGVLIPLQCEYYALEGLTQLLHTVARVRRHQNPGLKLEGIVLTMFDVRNNLSHQVAEDVRDHFGKLVFETVVPRNVRLSEAPSHGKPALLYDPKSIGAQRYLSLAREFVSGRRGAPGEEAAA